jgi:hypothetical protein
MYGVSHLTLATANGDFQLELAEKSRYSIESCWSTEPTCCWALGYEPGAAP